MEEKTRKFSRVLVLQTVTPVKDITDDEETRKIKHRHNQMTWGLIDNVSEKLGEFLPAMAGPCQICKSVRKRKEGPAGSLKESHPAFPPTASRWTNWRKNADFLLVSGRGGLFQPSVFFLIPGDK